MLDDTFTAPCDVTSAQTNAAGMGSPSPDGAASAKAAYVPGARQREQLCADLGLTIHEWEEVAAPGDELVGVGELIERLSMAGATVNMTLAAGAFVAARAADGRVGFVWQAGTTRMSLLEAWVARNQPLYSDEAFDAYDGLRTNLGRSTHVPGVPDQAYDFLRGQGVAVNADELAGIIGLQTECNRYLIDRRRKAGGFIALRHVSGGAGVVPTERVEDVLERLALEHTPIGTAADAKHREDFATLTGHQCRALLALRNQSLFSAVALYLFNKLMEDVHPAVVDDVLILAARLDVVLDGVHVGRAQEMTEALNRYVVEKSVLPDDGDRRRAEAVYLLYAIFEAIGDWIDLLPDRRTRDYFMRFQVALPRRSHKYIRVLQGLERRADQVAFATRKGRSDRLVAGYDQTRYAVEVRHAQMRRMHDAYEAASARIRAMPPGERAAALPYRFYYRETVPACGDAPEADQYVMLRLESRSGMIAEIAASPANPDAWVSRRAPGGADHDPNYDDDLMLEYVDTRPVRPGAPVRPLWLIDVVRSCFFHPPADLSPADKRRRREIMREMRMGPATAKDARQFFGFGNKHLNSDAYRSLRYLGRLFLPIKGMMMCSLVSRVFIRVMSTNGARPSEIMMLQADEGRWGEVYDIDNRVHVPYFEAVPKGKDDWAVFFIDEDTRAAIEELVDFVSWRWYGGGPLPTLPPAGNLHRKRLHGEPLPAQPWIMSWAGKALDHSEFSISMKAMFHGLGDWLPYDLRHAFAAVARAERMPKDVLMKVMHHEREEQNDHYSDPTAQAKAAFFTRFTLRRSYVSDMLARGEELLADGELEALRAIGVLGKTPGGQCLNSQPCHDATACVGCAFNRSDPAFRHELLDIEAHAREALERAEAAGFGRFVEQARRDVADVETQLREMDLVELAREDAARRAEIVSGEPTDVVRRDRA